MQELNEAIDAFWKRPFPGFPEDDSFTDWMAKLNVAQVFPRLSGMRFNAAVAAMGF